MTVSHSLMLFNFRVERSQRDNIVGLVGERCAARRRSLTTGVPEEGNLGPLCPHQWRIHGTNTLRHRHCGNKFICTTGDRHILLVEHIPVEVAHWNHLLPWSYPPFVCVAKWHWGIWKFALDPHSPPPPPQAAHFSPTPGHCAVQILKSQPQRQHGNHTFSYTVYGGSANTSAPFPTRPICQISDTYHWFSCHSFSTAYVLQL